MKHSLTTHSARFTVLLSLFVALFAQVEIGRTANPLDFSDITKPEFFPILPWDSFRGWDKRSHEGTRDGFAGIAECRFNLAGFVMPKDVRDCQRLGLGAIVLPSEKSFTNFSYLRAWRNLSDEEIERRIKSMVKGAGSNPAVKGFFIMDEPGLPDFPALGKAVAAVKKFAPGKWAYINLFPDYATIGAPDMSQLGTPNYTEYLERFVNEVHPQALSYDNYMVQMSHDLTMPNGESYFRNLLEVRRVALKYDLPYLNIASANQIRPTSTIPSPANLLLQAYTTLAAGYRGVTWYTYFARGYRTAPIDNTGKKTLTWFHLQEVNREITTLAPIMSRLKSTGVFFTAPTVAQGLPLLPGNLVQSVTCATPVMVGEFSDRHGKTFCMIVNLSLEKSAKFTITTKSAAESIQIVSSVDASLSKFDTKEGLWLVAGQGVLLQLGK